MNRRTLVLVSMLLAGPSGSLAAQESGVPKAGR